jgi:hypothetical protein
MTLALALCGCGRMGLRHIRGMQKLKAAGRLPFEWMNWLVFPES